MKAKFWLPSMASAAGQEPVGEKLYFFRSSVANEARVLVFAHGGHLWGDTDFTLDEGLTLHFNQPQHGEALTSNPWRQMFHNGQPRAGRVETFRGRTRVTDYSLGKGVGKHWEQRTTISYLEIRSNMESEIARQTRWTPHIVVVRRRFRGLGRLIKLSELVPAIRGHEPAVNTFYIAACRGDASSKRLLSTFVRI